MTLDKITVALSLSQGVEQNPAAPFDKLRATVQASDIMR
jgi:hypothetical protein